MIQDVVQRFQDLHPNLQVNLTIVDKSDYESGIRQTLTGNTPDVVNWYASNRMRPFVDAALFENVSDLWREPKIADNLGSTRGALTINGNQWGVPYTYYQWGLFYRRDVYTQLGLQEPRTWDAFKSNCRAILNSGRKCFTIGTKYLWTTGAWFDYRNMRVNGFDFHMDLAAGKVKWTDKRVRATFAHWKELIDMGAFINDHEELTWSDAIPPMVDGDAVHYLMGSFAIWSLQNQGLRYQDLDFYQFPTINPNVALAEDAPTDTLHIPANAQNKDAAREFLRFITSAEEQTEINNTINLDQMPVNSASTVGANRIKKEGFAMLSSNAPGGLAQFWDRDVPPAMAQKSMELFREFMLFPNRLDQILVDLEDQRTKSY